MCAYVSVCLCVCVCVYVCVRALVMIQRDNGNNGTTTQNCDFIYNGNYLTEATVNVNVI